MPKKYALARSKADMKLARARATISNARMKAKEKEQAAVEALSTVAAGAAISELERQLPVEFLRIPTKLWMAGLFYIGSAYLQKGYLASALKGMGDANLAIYSYKVTANVRSNAPAPLVAGELQGLPEEDGYFEYTDDRTDSVDSVGYIEVP